MLSTAANAEATSCVNGHQVSPNSHSWVSSFGHFTWWDLANLQALVCQLFYCMLPALPDIPIKDAKGIGWSCMTFSISDHCRCREAPPVHTFQPAKWWRCPKGQEDWANPSKKKKDQRSWHLKSKFQIKSPDQSLDIIFYKHRQATLLEDVTSKKITLKVWSWLEKSSNSLTVLKTVLKVPTCCGVLICMQVITGYIQYAFGLPPTQDAIVTNEGLGWDSLLKMEQSSWWLLLVGG